ncbi:MAG TPA: hypothetical protein VGY98_18565, partial [Verrucomicrobiae bacterium]|nr:hypothetical protein [Verrucomicrobiae bacterium]
LLDLWPLRRLNVPWRTSPLPSPAGGAGLSAELSKRPSAMGGGEGAPIQRLVAEKLPFFIVSAVFCVITFRIQSAHDALASFHQVGIGLRMENVICSYAGYLGKIFWPTGLAIIYPFPGSFDPVQVWLCALLLLAISALCLLQLPRRPYLAVGWFWFLGTLVPVVGLVQLGLQGMADRYTYLPMIGLVIALVWLVSDWVRTNSILKWTAGAATAAILLVCLVLTSRELPDWRDNIALFTHTIAVTRNNSLAEFPLAKGFEHKGLLRQAAVHYRIAIARGPDDENFWPNFYLAILFNKGGHYKEAKACLETAVKIKPNQPDSLNNLAWLLCTCPDKTVRDGETAVKLAEKACELTHDGSARYLTTLAAAYADVGQFDDAVATIQKAGGLAQETGQTQLFNADADLLQLFTNHQTYTDTSK